MYDVYLSNVLLPIAPEKITTQINGKNETREIKFTVPGKTGDTYTFRKIADGKDVDSNYFINGDVKPDDPRAWDIVEGTAKAGDVITVRMIGRGGFSFRFIKK